MQQRLRTLAPVPVGAVYMHNPGLTEVDARRHFRTMRELGFTCLKDVIPSRWITKKQLRQWALEEGIIPWWYGEAGWEPITESLLKSLGVPTDLPINRLREHPAVIEYQNSVMLRRIDEEEESGHALPAGGFLRKRDPKWRVPTEIPSELLPNFIEWLKKNYESDEKFKDAWNYHREVEGDIWEHLRENPDRIFGSRDLRRLRDLMRFKSDLRIEFTKEKAETAHDKNPHIPIRGGGEIGLFLPLAEHLADMEGIADIMSEFGSFYPSMHLSWHYEETNFSIIPEAYLQASFAQDLFKGGWSATWESSGGPQQISGGKGLHPGAEKEIPGMTVDAGVITQLMLSYLGAGFKGFGFWCWNPRAFGNEAGEYGLTDRNGNVCDRTVRAGLIGKTARKYRDELWAAHKEPMVGIFTDYENEMMWAAIACRGRDRMKRIGVEGRIGAGRALTRSNVPWEHVTGSDILSGLAPRYRVVYLPCVISLSVSLLDALISYVEEGGRLVVDCPSLWFDNAARVLDTGRGSRFERLFGCILRDFQYSSNVPRTLRGVRLGGCVVDLECGSARVLHTYDNGLPAIVENKSGSGSAVFLGYEASRDSYFARGETAEQLLTADVLGSAPLPFTCTGVYAFRLAAPSADHYFLVNEGEETNTSLHFGEYRYVRIEDALTGEKIHDWETVPVEAHGGRWLRCVKEEKG